MTPASVAGNRLLHALSKKDRALINKCLVAVTLTTREVLETPDKAIEHAYFVESGLASVVAVATAKNRIEVGMVGFEGMTGLSLLLGDDRSTNETMVQASGTALRISSRDLQRLTRSNPTFTATLLQYVNVFMVQTAQTALANGRGRLDERLARWLLMWRDRLRDDNLTLTHEFLSILLGVRRAGVTVALAELEGKGLIKTTRTNVRIIDRPGLRDVTNGFYGIPEAAYQRILLPLN